VAKLEEFGVIVIDLSQIHDSSSGSHSKFAGSPEVVRLIGAGMNRSGGFSRIRTPGLADMLNNLPIQISGG
jgi:esterase/lipase superfamily enzyme